MKLFKKKSIFVEKILFTNYPQSFPQKKCRKKGKIGELSTFSTNFYITREKIFSTTLWKSGKEKDIIFR